jgi:hypothetical protein
MRNRLWLALVIAVPGLAGAAGEGVELGPKSRAIIADAAAGNGRSEAPFARGRDGLPAMLLASEPERRIAPGSCRQAGHDFCYELAERRIVYRPARRLLPRVEGLTPESVSLRHDRLVIRYSFR